MIVCLAIMAKAPADVVLRCIESAQGYAQKVCLVVAPGDPLLDLDVPILDDTIARPTRTIEQPWLGYAATRTATLRHAEADPSVDWILMLDAYTTVAGALPVLASTDADSFEVAIEDTASQWRWLRHGHLTRARRGFAFKGALHEQLIVPPESRLESWPHLVVRGTASPKSGAGRSYERDAQVLGCELARNPTDTRTAFYYAQSLKDAGRLREAFDAFTARARMSDGWTEETFWALMWRAKLAEFIHEDVVTLYLEAEAFAPDRAEPLAGLESYFRRHHDHGLALIYGRASATKPYPTRARLFVDLTAYSPEALREAGITV